RREVEARILDIKDNDVALDHYIRDILSPIEDNLRLFFSPKPFYSCTAFQKLVPFINSYNSYDELPKEMAAIHRSYIDEMVSFGFLELNQEEKEKKIEEFCANTWSCFQKRKEIPSYAQCRYFIWLFRNVASMIESALLEAGCAKDLFWYQTKYDIVLYPSLTTRDLWANSVFSEDVAQKVARGYSTLDRYTEMAGYAVYETKVRVGEIICSGIPEVDALLKQTNTRTPADYPTYHFKRNLYSFSTKCQAIAESAEPLERKKFRVRELVHILGHCYDTFNNVPQLRNYVNYVIHFFSVLEASLLRCPEPICVKEMCMDLHYDTMLTDIFPDTDISKVILMTQKIEPDTQWEPYYLAKSLGKSLDYYEKQVCSTCERLDCPFRKTVNAKANSQLERLSPPPVDLKKQLADSLVHVCTQIEPKLNGKVQRVKGKKQWVMNNDALLYAYIGVALQRHLKLKSISWETMATVLVTTADGNYLKGSATEYRKMFKGELKKDFPSAHYIVDDAIDKLKNGKQRS
ncbi:MAG: hypothetical protein IJU69_04520, partial [Bacteroidales bacterium]|nr:hypothetical protein [Bacteroidales bacterium]